MLNKSIGIPNPSTQKISSKLESVSLNSIRKVLSDHLIIKSCNEVGYSYRNRKLTPIVIILHMIMAAIWPEESFTASWQRLWSGAVGVFPEMAGKSSSRGTVSRARNRLPIELWNKLFAAISDLSQGFSSRCAMWKDHRVILLDGTTLSMSDNKELTDEFGKNSGHHGEGKYPLMRMVSLCLCNTMTILSYNFGNYKASEISLAWSLLAKLSKGDLLLADRHFAAAHYYSRYYDIGIDFLTRIHQNRKLCYISRFHEYSDRDFIGFMKINKIYRRKDESLPTKVMVRFTQVVMRIRGKRKVIWLVSSLLDNKIYSASEIAQLYAKRWRIETLFKEVKGFSTDVLRSQSVAGIKKELAAKLIAVNVVRVIIIESALVCNVDPIRISFAGAVRSILAFSPALGTSAIWKLPLIYEGMLKEIASHLVPHRPDRNEPRAVRREKKHYSSLKGTRKEWRQNNVA